MLNRHAAMAALLGASLGVPYMVSKSNSGSAPEAAPSEAATPQAPAIAPLPRETWGPNSHIFESPAPLEGVRVYSLAEVLRWDITKDWVYQRWARKSTGLADLDRFGIRVPLVTGTGVSDLAGSLSYYFDQQGQLQHIAFRGRTGDTTPLVQLLVTKFGFERQPDALPGEQLYQVKKRGLVQSQLRTRPEAVLWSTSPHSSFVVELDFERPGNNRFLDESPPKLEIPQVATAPQASPLASQAAIPSEAQPGQASGDAADEAESATTQLEVQVRQRRWPN